MRRTFVYDDQSKKMVEVTRASIEAAPWVHRGLEDPQNASQAVPRALKQLEAQHSASRIVRDMGFTLNEVKQTWKI